MRKVLIVVGSVRKESINQKLAENLIRIGDKLASFSIAPIHDLPMYCQDDDASVPAPVLRFKESIASADGILFVTPEYNRSVPPLLKNAVDWGSRPWGQNTWAGKPAALAGISIGSVGTAVAQAHLRSSLTMLGMALMGQPEIYPTEHPGFFNENGYIASEKTCAFLHGFLKAFTDWIALYKK